MGTLVDTSVLIHIERARLVNLPQLEADVGIAAVSFSELLHGVHRADPGNRPRREAFVEAVARAFPIVPFDESVARVHARLWAEIESTGKPIGPHDLQIAATAITLGWSVLTRNPREFARVPGLDVVEPG